MNIGDPKPDKIAAESSTERQERKTDAYTTLLDNYQRVANEMRKLSRRFAGNVTDPEVDASMRVLDNERHHIHLQLLDEAKMHNQSESDVLTDILRREGSLEEYGLPEFAIMTHEDFNDGDFNVADDGRIKRPKIPKEVGVDAVEHVVEDDGWHDEDRPTKDEVLLVYSTGPERFTTYVDAGIAIWPRDFVTRLNRARALADAIHSRMTMPRNGDFHDASINVMGVIIKKSEIEKVASIIRNADDTYRIGEKHYSATEKKQIDGEFMNMVEGDLKHLEYLCEEAMDARALPSKHKDSSGGIQNMIRETIFEDLLLAAKDYFALRTQYYNEEPPSAKELKKIAIRVLATLDKLPDRFLPEPTIPPPAPSIKVAEVLPEVLARTSRPERSAGGIWEQIDKRWWRCPSGHSVKGTKTGAPSACDICEREKFDNL